MPRNPLTYGDQSLSPATNRVLLAEDARTMAKILESQLTSWGYEVTVVHDGKDAWEVLRGPNAPTLSVVDWVMPGMTGLELVRKIRELDPEPYRYLIMLTAKSEKSDIIRGLEAGADDYLTKPVDMDELEVRLWAGKRIIKLQTQLLRASETLRYQASHDPLTGLWNHVSILEFLDRELSRGQRHGTGFAAAMIDLDHFKNVNDTYGHQGGDRALVGTARLLETITRRYDTVGRYGGEEFMVILPDCDKEGAMLQMERMRAAVEASPVEHDGQIIQLSASFGVAVWTPGQPVDAHKITKAADMALYQAKREGRNRVEFHDII